MDENFSAIGLVEIFFAAYEVKKHAVSRKKIPRQLMVFLIIRDEN